MALHASEFLSTGSPFLTAVLGLGLVVIAAIASRVIHCLYFHPLRHFPGPWYLACSSLPMGLISVIGKEPEFLIEVVKKYGKDGRPVRIMPSLLLFHKASALREIYWDPACNNKSSMYGHESIGPTSLFTTLDGQEHKAIRKALGGAWWASGSLKKNWETRVDDLIRNFKANQTKRINNKEIIVLSDKVAEFAAEVATMILFTTPWGFIRNDRDERSLLHAFREGLPLFALAQRWRFFREVVLRSWLGPYVVPKLSDTTGNGWLVSQAGREIAERQRRIDEERYDPEPRDFLQIILEARADGEPLSEIKKLANVTLAIQAAADTTGSALGITLRFLVTHPEYLRRIREEIDEADSKGLLSQIVQYDETKAHLPLMCAAVREGLRLGPPVSNLLPRIAPPGGKVIEGEFIPEGAEMTSQQLVVQQDVDMFGAEPDKFRLERWLGPSDKTAEMDASLFVFGMGPRVCIGKEIALLELHKVLPEIIRRFDMELVKEGKYVWVGGLASHKPGFEVKMSLRNEEE